MSRCTGTRTRSTTRPSRTISDSMPLAAHRDSHRSDRRNGRFRSGGARTAPGATMGYSLNFNLIWRYGDKLWGGLVLSLELAVFAIAIGSVIGLALAIAYVSGGKVVRT